MEGVDIPQILHSIKSLSTKILNIINGITIIVPPIGSWYTQYNSSGTFLSAEEPATLFGGGTWSQEFTGTDGEFFKQAGSSGGQTRSSGLQPDQGQGHYHSFSGGQLGQYVGGTVNYIMRDGNALGHTATDWKAKTIITDGTNGTPRIGTVTEPTNREIKVWKRTS